MKFRKPWQHRWIGRIGNVFLRMLGATWRMRVEIPADPEPAIYLFLHGNILLSALMFRDRGYPIVISTHRDGEVIAQISQRLGYRPIRGSSTRGGAGAVFDVLRNHDGTPVAITPDGPRGPRADVKPGLVRLASLAGRRIIPMGFATDRAKRFDSWDRFVIPYPFAKIQCVFGAPLDVPPEVDDDTAAALAQRASAHLLDTEAAAERTLRG